MRSPRAHGEPPGEDRLEVNGIVYETGTKVQLKPTDGGTDIQDAILKDRIATIETIYVDYEDNIHLAVTVDEDPGQNMRQDLGLYLYFSPDEVEVVEDR